MCGLLFVVVMRRYLLINSVVKLPQLINDPIYSKHSIFLKHSLINKFPAAAKYFLQAALKQSSDYCFHLELLNKKYDLLVTRLEVQML